MERRGLRVSSAFVLSRRLPLPPHRLFPSLHPVAFVELGLVLGVRVLHGDAARQDGGHVVADALVFSLLLSLLLHFPQLYACSGGKDRDGGKIDGLLWEDGLVINQNTRRQTFIFPGKDIETCRCDKQISPFLMASRRTLRASLMGGRLAGWCLLVPTSCMAWGGGEAMAPAEGKAGTGGGPDGQGDELRAPGRGRGGGGGGGGRMVPSD